MADLALAGAAQSRRHRCFRDRISEHDSGAFGLALASADQEVGVLQPGGRQLLEAGIGGRSSQPPTAGWGQPELNEPLDSGDRAWPLRCGRSEQ